MFLVAYFFILYKFQGNLESKIQEYELVDQI